VYLDLGSAPGFTEDGFVGRTVRLGPKVTIAVLERDARCKMITIDPDTAEPSGAILRKVSRAHDGKAGVYGAVLAAGTVRPGDAIALLS
jgi:MOSC domain-containing protein YiiM